MRPFDVVTVAVLPALAEETLFRGALLPAIGVSPVGVVGAGVVFGASHAGRRKKRGVRRVGAFCTLVPIRPRSRGERRSLRTFPGASHRSSLAFNTRARRLSTPSDAFELHPGERRRVRVRRVRGGDGEPSPSRWRRTRWRITPARRCGSRRTPTPRRLRDARARVDVDVVDRNYYCCTEKPLVARRDRSSLPRGGVGGACAARASAWTSPVATSSST